MSPWLSWVWVWLSNYFRKTTRGWQTAQSGQKGKLHEENNHHRKLQTLIKCFIWTFIRNLLVLQNPFHISWNKKAWKKVSFLAFWYCMILKWWHLSEIFFHRCDESPPFLFDLLNTSHPSRAWTDPWLCLSQSGRILIWILFLQDPAPYRRFP